MFAIDKCLAEDYIGSDTGTCLGRCLFFGMGISGFQFFQLFHYLDDRQRTLLVLPRQSVEVVGQLVVLTPSCGHRRQAGRDAHRAGKQPPF